MTQRVCVRIHPDRIRDNYRRVRALLQSGCQVLAIVKADAYGHGAAHIARVLREEGCQNFAVACLEEAVALRDSGIKENILILGPTDPSRVPELERYDLIQTVGSVEDARLLSEGGNSGLHRVHIKVDTGMSRLGIYCHSPADAELAAEKVKNIQAMKNLSVEGIFTHFADSDGESDAFTKRQFLAFSALLSLLEKQGVNVGVRHCCNSAAIVRFPEMHLDMVRAGLILYGFSPSPYAEDKRFLPGIELIARVAAVNKIRKGDTVSYGCLFRAERDMRVGVLSIGYADGLPRSLSGKLTVTINGKECPLIGNICMDLCMVDLKDTECKPGDEAVIYDSAEKIEEIAKKLGTISYEVCCLLKSRVVPEYVTP